MGVEYKGLYKTLASSLKGFHGFWSCDAGDDNKTLFLETTY